LLLHAKRGAAGVMTRPGSATGRTAGNVKPAMSTFSIENLKQPRCSLGSSKNTVQRIVPAGQPQHRFSI
jgi:hypothetical protein